MFRRLLTLEAARKTVNEYSPSKPAGSEDVSLLEAYSRDLAEDVVSSLDIPPFSRSTVDGYAVKAEDTFDAEESKPVRLKVCGMVSVGKLPKIAVKSGAAVEIVTGAPVPSGADAVVMVEDTEREGNHVNIYTAVVKDENIMKAGMDVQKGEKVLKKGRLLGSREIGVLAAVGKARVRVYAVPRVAVLSTGAEITEPGKKLQKGKVYDINAYSLSTAIVECGGKPVYFGVFPDNLSLIQKALKDALASADLVVTSGGVSVGPKDFMPKALDSLGKPGVIVCGLAIKPGKPVTIASLDGKLVFSLPGHPASALLVFYLLVRPMILKMAGRSPEEIQETRALAAVRMFPAKGRRTFIMVRLKRNEVAGLVAEPVASGQSGAITTLAKADGFVEIPENQQFVDAREEVTVRLFSNGIMKQKRLIA